MLDLLETRLNTYRSTLQKVQDEAQATINRGKEVSAALTENVRQALLNKALGKAKEADVKQAVAASENEERENYRAQMVVMAAGDRITQLENILEDVREAQQLVGSVGFFANRAQRLNVQFVPQEIHAWAANQREQLKQTTTRLIKKAEGVVDTTGLREAQAEQLADMDDEVAALREQRWLVA